MNGLNRSSLVWGAVFCVIGLAFLLEEVGVWQVRLSVLLPTLLVAGGLVLAASAVLPDRPEARR